MGQPSHSSAHPCTPGPVPVAAFLDAQPRRGVDVEIRPVCSEILSTPPSTISSRSSSVKFRDGSDGRSTLKAMLLSVARANCEREWSSSSIRAADGRLVFLLADHVAYRDQQAKFGVDDLDFAHGRKRSGRPVARKPPRNSPDVAGWSRRGVASD